MPPYNDVPGEATGKEQSEATIEAMSRDQLKATRQGRCDDRNEDISEQLAPTASLATVRMIEYSSDEKPDIWFKAEVVCVSGSLSEIEALLNKFGLPKAIAVNCIAQQVEVRNRMINEAHKN